MAIVSFKDRRMRDLLDGREPHKSLPGNVTRVLRRKLEFLETAGALTDLRQPSSNHFEKLRSDRAGQHSIRVNDQFRLCFVWTPGGPADVEFVDYH